jgi:hypothetical protein
MLMKEHFEHELFADGQYVKQNTMTEGVEFHASDDEKAQAAAHAINTHDQMAVLLSSHRAFFEGILEHAPADAPIESLDIYHNMINEIDEVLNHG